MKQAKQYVPFERVSLPDRQWPDKIITKAPIWCSVDLRDGNQALVTPMGIEEKLTFFHTLVDVGFHFIHILIGHFSIFSLYVSCIQLDLLDNLIFCLYRVLQTKDK